MSKSEYDKAANDRTCKNIKTFQREKNGDEYMTIMNQCGYNSHFDNNTNHDFQKRMANNEYHIRQKILVFDDQANLLDGDR